MKNTNYVSEIDYFLHTITSKPEIKKRQAEHWALWWDKDPNEVGEITKLACKEIKQAPYVYYSYHHNNLHRH